MVLLIDDDEDFRRALADNLADDGRLVIQYARPEEVPPLQTLERLSVLIVDYQTRGEDGLSFADRFHAFHPDIPIVRVRAYLSNHLEGAAAARPFLVLRRKPVDYDELAALLPSPR